MKTTRRKIIKNKIFTKADIRRIWAEIVKEHTDLVSKKNHTSIRLGMHCLGDISYESETDDLLQDGDVIDIKRCTKMSIEYHDYDEEKRISLSLSHGNSSDNHLVVRGDKNWVAGLFDSLSGIIEAAQPQEHWFIKYKTVFLHIGALFVGYLVHDLLDIIWYQHTQPIENPSENIQAIRGFFHENPLVLYIVQGGLFWLQGILPVKLLIDWVLKLWPIIEFDFGPEHKKNEKIRRRRLLLFFSAFIIPLLLNFLYDWFTR